MTEELRFAALLGYLSASRPAGSAKEMAADAGRAITAAVAARYGDLGSPPAVMAIRSEDVRERTPGGPFSSRRRTPSPSRHSRRTRPRLASGRSVRPVTAVEGDAVRKEGADPEGRHAVSSLLLFCGHSTPSQDIA
ncbi:hypothetical protein ACFQX6_05760 [Streptosporangium lutulentum]